jgi:hypothetical protein
MGYTGQELRESAAMLSSSNGLSCPAVFVMRHQRQSLHYVLMIRKNDRLATVQTASET